MSWITATTLEGKNANLQTQQIEAVIDRVKGSPGEGSLILLASGTTLEVTESPAELLRSIEEESPQGAAGPAW
ncbi:MAG TPA: hypothetical protein VKK31_08840 [Thermoanaerobaculia bacterium]|nr:hypothetical protein [Thermoanaerobaculia bacterium]